ncbi:MAG: ABC transporter permease [Anaerolineae bacterium]|nr:ABC transporter permease [Anaerolineae bacterium]MDW8099922.1 ABC transporter permease [Anaerolineae bacterium]
MRLRDYVIRRLLLVIPVLFGLSVVTFVVSRMVPGDPVKLAAGPQAKPEEIQRLIEEFGLDKPLVIQYLNYMKGLFQGNLGRSMLNRHLVRDDLAKYFPATLELVLVSMAFAIVIGIPAAVLAAVYRDRWPDQVSRIIALSGISMPLFWLAIMLQLILGQWLRLLPISGRFDPRLPYPREITGLLLLDTLLLGDLKSFFVALKYIFLPALTQSLIALALIMRLLRADILEVLQKDFVRMARANGIPERIILFKYVLKNGLIATVSMLGFLFGFLLGGSVMVETVFNWPGLGLYSMNSALSLDFQPIMGITLFVGLLFTLVNLATDLMYGVLDPRIRYG